MNLILLLITPSPPSVLIFNQYRSCLKETDKKSNLTQTAMTRGFYARAHICFASALVAEVTCRRRRWRCGAVYAEVMEAGCVCISAGVWRVGWSCKCSFVCLWVCDTRTEVCRVMWRLTLIVNARRVLETAFKPELAKVSVALTHMSVCSCSSVSGRKVNRAQMMYKCKYQPLSPG